MKSIKIATNVFLFMAIIMISVYVFSRFTVDDAFISWRYGKNLIDFGVWNFNPSNLDPTQAYTSPIFALLSIIPVYFKWDVVLFFKIISSILLISFLYWSLKITKKSYLLVLPFLAIPATIIHIYSGLETFLFVFLMAALLVSMYEEKKRASVILTLFLFLTRPESFPLVILLPVYYLFIEPKSTSIRLINPLTYLKELKYLSCQATSILIATAIPLFAYFLFHYIHFGNILPNTFYAKSSLSFNFANFIKYSIFIIPTFLLLYSNGRIKLGLFITIMFGAMALSYSMSNLQMDYAGRFAFQIFAPIYIFWIYFTSKTDGRIFFSLHDDFMDVVSIKQKQLFTFISFSFLLVFTYISA